MSKLLVAASAMGLAALIAAPGAASAREQTGAGMKNSNLIEVSSARRHHVYRHGDRRYGWSHRYRPYGYRSSYSYYGGGPYGAYAYDPYYRHYRPGLAVGVGPFGFGFGF